MTAIGAERQRIDPPHGRHRQRAVEMREQVVVARALPFQRRPEDIGIDRQQQQIRLPGIMLRRRFGHLPRRREMDEAVAQVMGGAGEDAGRRGLRPFGRRQDAVDQSGHGEGHSMAAA